MDQSLEDSKRLKRSGKKRPQSSQQQEGGTNQTVSASTTVSNITTSTVANSTVGNATSGITGTSTPAASSLGQAAQTSQNTTASNPSNSVSPLGQQSVGGKGVQFDESSLQQGLTVHSELIEYVNKLEYLVVSTRQKLLRERKAYQQIISSLALFFDAKGIRSQQVEEYVDSVIDSIKANQEESDLDFEQLDWVRFLQDKKVENSLLVKRQRELLDLQGSNPIASSVTGAFGTGGNLANSSTINNGASNLSNSNASNLQQLSSLQNAKSTANGLASSSTAGTSTSNSGNIIRLPMTNGGTEEKKGASSSSSQVQQKQKSKGSITASQVSTSSQSQNKNQPTTAQSNNSLAAQNIIDADGEEPKNKKKKKPNPVGNNFNDISGLAGNAANQQLVMQQYLMMASHQEQQKLLYQQFLQAQQINQIQPKMSDQVFQQYLLSLQQQQNAQ